MNLPDVLADLVKAQNLHDSVAYANCFSESAIVIDEGRTYKGKADIQQWIATANENYNTFMKPLDFRETEPAGVLKAEVSGSFPGSPTVLNYHLETVDGLIQSLKVLSE